jgi:uncharacterized membrane protein
MISPTITQRTLSVSLGRQGSLRLPAEFLALCLIVAAAAFLRLFYLGEWSLWIDELHTLQVARDASLTSRGVPADQHPPLYYLFISYWISWGHSEAWLRLPSAVGGLLAVILMWCTGAAWGRRDVALLAAALLAFSALHIWYSREARMYGPATFFWLAAIYFSVQLWRRQSWVDAIGLGASTAAGLLMAYPTFALWLGQGALFLAASFFEPLRPKRLLKWLLAQSLIAAAFWAWWPYLRFQLQRSAMFHWHLPGLPQWGFSGTLEETLRLGIVAGVAGLVLLLVGGLLLSRLRERLPGL